MQDLINSYKQSAKEGMQYFLRNFSYVPDDKLNWAVVPTAKTPMRIAAHTALYPARFAQMLRDKKAPAFDNLDEWLAQREAEEIAVTSREEMERIFREGTDEFIAALDTLTQEDIDGKFDSGQGWSMPMTWLMGLAGWHATLHAGQIDFLQTCWDDQKIYIG